jgi:hypothetical protein
MGIIIYPAKNPDAASRMKLVGIEVLGLLVW